MARKTIADELIDAVRDAVVRTWPDLSATSLDIQLGQPQDRSHGDYSTNVAFLLARTLKRKPFDIAQALVTAFEGPASASAAAPGFLNFRVHEPRLHENLRSMETSDWGRTDSGSGQRVNIEYVSANPTGPLHVGHGRGAVIGDTVVRLLRCAGFEVTREYYVNDVGAQIERLGESLLAEARRQRGLDAGGYAVSYPVEEEAASWLMQGGGIDASDAAGGRDLVLAAAAFAKKALLDRIMAELGLLGIGFDTITYESSLTPRIPLLIERLRAGGFLYEAEQAEGTQDAVRRSDSKAAQHAHAMEGGTFLRTSRFGDETDRIILRANGSPTYFTTDIVYHVEKFERGYGLLVNVWGADHGGHVKRLQAALEAVGAPADQLEVILCQMVRLVRGGQEVKMSKRAGTAISLADLVAEVGADAVRFFFLLRSPSSQFDFDLDLAVAQSADNPVYYCQYAYARTRQLLAKGLEHNLAPSPGALERLTDDSELLLMQLLARLPASVRGAALARESHRLPALAMELAQALHQYQTAGKSRDELRVVRPDEPACTAARLYLVERVGQGLKFLLDLMGVGAPERMERTAD